MDMIEASKKKMPIFAARFGELRGDRTQAEFAEFLGISRPTVGFYENGERIPDAVVLRQIAEKCGVTADYLLGLSDNKSLEYENIGNITGLSDKAIETLKIINSTTVGDYKAICNEFIISGDFYWQIHLTDVFRKKIEQAISNSYKYIELVNELIVGKASDESRMPLIKEAVRIDEKRQIALFSAQENAKNFLINYAADVLKEEKKVNSQLDKLYEQYVKSEFFQEGDGGPVKRVWGYEDVYDTETW